MISKEILRKEFKQKRRLFSDEALEQSSQKIFENLVQLPIWENSHFHVFLPIESLNEVNTIPIIDYLFQHNKKVYVPKVVENELISIPFTEETQLSTSQWNILEPLENNFINESILEVVFIPMLICDKKGNRIGYGKGFYDKLLAKCKPNCIKIGLNFFEPIEEEFTVQNTDIPLDYCVIPLRTVSFSVISDK